MGVQLDVWHDGFVGRLDVIETDRRRCADAACPSSNTEIERLKNANESHEKIISAPSPLENVGSVVLQELRLRPIVRSWWNEQTSFRIDEAVCDASLRASNLFEKSMWITHKGLATEP
ncbi:hypothetical protein [Rhizobium yanglingense]